jgi:hypothetical protein
VISKISAHSVHQILLNRSQKLWRKEMWLLARVPRGAVFAAEVQEIWEPDTSPLPEGSCGSM